MSVNSRILMTLLMIALIFSSCDTRREILPDKRMELTINIDWSELSSKPLVTSILLYNRDQSSVIVHQTNYSTTTVMLDAGVYDLICFNESIGAHENIEFRGVDSYQTIEAYAQHFTVTEGYEVEAEEQTIREPSVLAVDRYENLVIERDYSESYSKVVNLRPESIISTLDLKVNFKGLDNLSNVNLSSAAISGMAEGILLSTGAPNGSKGVNYFYFGPKSYDLGSLENGHLRGTLRCFGPAQGVTRSGAENIVTLFLKLRNGTDYLTDQGERVTRDVTQSMVYDSSLKLHINLELGLGESGDPLIVIPYVEDSEGGKQTGFDAEIEDWGDEDITDIPIG